MPRRPLFCQTCDDLLNQLASAADAITAGDPVVTDTGGTERHYTLEVRTDLRDRYFELRERVVLHLEVAHDPARTSRQSDSVILASVSPGVQSLEGGGRRSTRSARAVGRLR